MRALLRRRRPLAIVLAGVQADLGGAQADIVAVQADLPSRATTAAVNAALAVRDAAIDVRELIANRGRAGGYPALDGAGRLPAGQLPTHGHGQADVTGLDAALAARPSHTFTQTLQDHARTQTSLADVGDFPQAVLANTDYAFELVLFYQSAAVGCGLSLSMNGPASPAGRQPVWESAIQTTGGPSLSAINTKAQSAADALHTTASVDAANTPRIARYFGFWPVGRVGGTLAIRFASEVANTEVKILRGSWLKVY